jgi:hypothetical protein
MDLPNYDIGPRGRKPAQEACFGGEYHYSITS